MREDYHSDKMIHLNETLKLFIRTGSTFHSDSQRQTILLSLLPDSEEDSGSMRFKCGGWFQALRGIGEQCDLTPALKSEFELAFRRVKVILKKHQFFEYFLGELEYADYTPFKDRLCEMGLHEKL